MMDHQIVDSWIYCRSTHILWIGALCERMESEYEVGADTGLERFEK